MLNKYGFYREFTDPSKYIDRDLKICPWLKVFGYNVKTLEVTYIDEIRGDLWKRVVNNSEFVLRYVGRLARYYELIKEDKDNAQST